jgi:NAD(P)H-quinone oxidoreductase subunit 5
MINQIFGTWIALAVFLPWLLGEIPHWFMHLSPQASRRLTTRSITLSFLIIFSGLLFEILYAPVILPIAALEVFGFVVHLGLFFDRLSSILLCSVAAIATGVARYANRNIAGEPRCKYFFRILAITCTLVFLLLTAQNLVMLFIAWVGTSLYLHRLLTFYPERPLGVLAAKTKFIINRFGDFFLLLGLVLLQYHFKTLSLPEILYRAHELRASSTLLHEMIAVFLVIAALTKSAQFPFHTWLPDTLECPTPVSAFMHAGIINAGGFLLIRTQPLFANTAVAPIILVTIGTLTSIIGALSMMTKTDIKRTLAHSTVAQMGFMMLQCGLGAYPAAVLHMIAHGAYKSNAFLYSGTITRPLLRIPSIHFGQLMGAFLLSLLGTFCFLSASQGFHLVPHYNVILVVVLTGAFFHVFHFGLALQEHAWTSIQRMLMIVIGYVGFYALLEKWMVPLALLDASHDIPFFYECLCLVLFVSMFILQIYLCKSPNSPFIRRLYVSSMNGFYLGTRANKWVRSLYSYSR